jgi:acyl-CoA reductase-like NAD-dependent aldehyde dehydrogenase
MPIDGERVVEKAGFNPFHGGELECLLGEWGTECVWLAGLHLHACVRTAAVECLERALQVRIAEDATGSNDPVHAAATRRWLGERCVHFEPVASLLSDGGSASGHECVWRTPRDLEQIAFRVPLGGVEEVARAVARAVMAGVEWRRTAWATRSALLEGIAARIEAAAIDLPRQLAVEIGKPLSEGQEEIRRADVAAVTLTGSTRAGHALQEICARRWVPFQAELNGNNAAMVWEGADLAAAAVQLAWGAFAFAGQRCTANRRVITAGKRDDLAQELAEVQSTGRAHRLVLTHKEEARQAWVRRGAYAQPVILGCDQPDDPLVQEESMGPRLIVQRADDFDHALSLCNGVPQGLIASLFGGSRELRARFLAEARAGGLKLDQATAGVDVTLPFGGWKASGIGPPEHGEADRLFYTRLQTIYGATDRV